MVVESLVALKEATPQGETIRETTSNKPMQDKGKRKIVESIKTEQCYKFKEDPLVERVALEIDSKM